MADVPSFRGEDLDRWVRDFVDRVREAAELSFGWMEPAIAGEYRRPRHDLVQEGEQVYIVVEMPGCSKEKIDLRISGSEIEVLAEYADPTHIQYKRLQPFRETKGYRKTITVSRRLDPTAAEARYENGLLFIRIPLARISGEKVRID